MGTSSMMVIVTVQQGLKLYLYFKPPKLVDILCGSSLFSEYPNKQQSM